MERRCCAACEQAFRPRAQSPGSCIAVSLLVSVSGGGAGRRTSASATRITAPTKRGRSGSGPPITAITGASGEPHTPNTPSAIGWRSVGAMASGKRHVLQRWTRHRRLTGDFQIGPLAVGAAIQA